MTCQLLPSKVSLKKDFVINKSRQRPLTFDQRQETEISESSNTLQHLVDSLVGFSEDKQMKINSTKSSVMKICKSRTRVYPTEIVVGDDLLDVKKEMKVLGVILTPNLKWSANTAYICKKAYKNMWMVRTMKVMDLDTFTMVDYYMKKIRVHLELVVPVWQSGLTLNCQLI